MTARSMRHLIRLVESASTSPPPTLYHFTTVKRLLAILSTGQLKLGANGRVSFTDDPEQRLFRYMPAALVFDGHLGNEVDLTRYEGDAASLAGGDEREFYATQNVTLRPHLRAVLIRPNTFDEPAASFKATFGMSKKEVRARLAALPAEGVAVTVSDFNDGDTEWHRSPRGESGVVPA